MKMFQYEDEDGNFIIEHLDTNGNLVPVFQVTGSEVFLSGSLLPADPLNSASAELGSEEKPWKELYVESASINFIDTSKAVGDARRKVRFSRKDVEDLKEGRSLNENGILSASGDMHVAGNSLFKGTTIYDGVTKLKGETQVTGALRVEGAADFRGQFRVNGNRIQEGELRVLEGITATTDELNIMDGVTATTTELNIMDGVTATTAELNKIDGFTGTVADLNYAKDLRATGVTTTEFNRLDGVTVSAVDINSVRTKVDSTDGRVRGSLAIDALQFGTNAPGQTLTVNGHISGSGITTTDKLLVKRTAQFSGPFVLDATPTSITGTNSQIIDARAQNSFIVSTNLANIVGIRGTGSKGQIVTIYCLGSVRATIHHAESGIAAGDQFQLLIGRDISLRAPRAIQFYCTGTTGWITV